MFAIEHNERYILYVYRFNLHTGVVIKYVQRYYNYLVRNSV